MAFRDYSITPASNTTLADGTYVGPNMLRNKVRPALQQIMADGKDMADTVDETADLVEGIVAGSAAVLLAPSASRAILATQDTSLPAYLKEAGREGIFVFSSANLSTYVTADTTQGIYVAPASDTDGSSGAWVRKFDGPVNAQWWGFLPSGTAAGNVTAFNAMLATIDALAVSGGYGLGALAVYIPPDNTQYQLNASIEIRLGLRIFSSGTKLSAGAKLKWTTQTSGFRIQSSNTTGASGVGSGLDSAAGATLDGLWIIGNYDGTGADAEAHGVHCRGQFYITNCMIQYWAGDGIHAKADVTDAGLLGNVNCSNIDNVWIESVRHGLYAYGGDANVIEVNALSVVGARGYGIRDQSFLGNTYTNMHISTCGEKTASVDRPTCFVSHGGYVYQVVPGREVQAAANAPSGTTADTANWLYCSMFPSTTGIVAWSAAIPIRTLGGGGFFIGGASQTSLVANPYVEADSGHSFVGPLTFVSGRGQSAIVYADGGGTYSRNAPVIRAAVGQVYIDSSVVVKGGLATPFDVVATPRINFDQFDAAGSYTGRAGYIDFHPDLYLRYYAKAAKYHSFQIDAGPEVMRVHTDGVQVVYGSLGYVTGAGGAVTQATSRTTGVTLNKAAGAITLVSAAGSTTPASFTVTNSLVAATDTIILSQKSGTDKYDLRVTAVGAGSFEITFATLSGTTTEQPVFNFAVIKAVAA